MNKKQIRALIVRVIEDAIILLCMVIGIWVVASIMQNGLAWLGVLK